MSATEFHESRIAPLDLEHGPHRPDRAFAHATYGALSKYLRLIKSHESPSSLSQDVVDALPDPAEPTLDPNGYWRLGAWLLEARGGNPALTYRPAQLEPRIEYIALFATPHGDTEGMAITSLTRGKIYPRR